MTKVEPLSKTDFSADQARTHQHNDGVKWGNRRLNICQFACEFLVIGAVTVLFATILGKIIPVVAVPLVGLFSVKVSADYVTKVVHFIVGGLGVLRIVGDAFDQCCTDRPISRV